MTAAEVKAALYRRHPATQDMGFRQVPGQWTCIEEWRGIDLMAWRAWGGGYRVGYEVKVSRGDFRTELLNPAKRKDAVSLCNRFYFAVPEGLLKPAEIAYVEPEWRPEDFERVACPGIGGMGNWPRHWRETTGPRPDYVSREYGGRCVRLRRDPYTGKRVKGWWVKAPVPRVLTLEDSPYRAGSEAARIAREQALLQRARDDQGETYVLCPRCGGKGYVDVSPAEKAAPTLWVPRECGLIEVSSRGCRVAKEAPAQGCRGLSEKELCDLVRWTSARPDFRHKGLVAAVA